jgi:energy-coupling factor transporter ATP-binding protein EcfA2
MGVVIVGPSGSGKSVLWKMLQHAMQKVGQTVRTYVMNPKSMPRIQLLGHIDIDTREWSDGVLTAASRAVVKEPLGKTNFFSILKSYLFNLKKKFNRGLYAMVMLIPNGLNH